MWLKWLKRQIVALKIGVRVPSFTLNICAYSLNEKASDYESEE